MGSYELQHGTRLSNRDAILRSISNGNKTFASIVRNTKLSRRTVNLILKDLMASQSVVRKGEGRKITYELTSAALESLQLMAMDAFHRICDDFKKWHPSLREGEQYTSEGLSISIGTLVHAPVIQTATMITGEVDSVGNPTDDIMPVPLFLEELIHRDVFSLLAERAKGHAHVDGERHGRMHVVVTVDFDHLDAEIEMADRLEDGVVKGDGLTLTFSTMLNADIRNHPDMLSDASTGLTEPPFITNFEGREFEAALLLVFRIPEYIMILQHRHTAQEMESILLAMGKHIDGPFKSALEKMMQTHRDFMISFAKEPNKGFYNLAFEYLKGFRSGKVTSQDFLELMSLFLWFNLMNGNMPLVYKALRYWGTPFMFLRGSGNQ